MAFRLHLPLLAFCASIALSGGAFAQVAMVEEVHGKGVPVEELDYLAEGKVIALPAHTTVTIGYFRSCQREVITGGTVTVGVEASRVDGGTVRRERVECDGGRMLLTAEQASKSGVVAMRGGPPRRSDPQFVVFSTSPVIEMKRAGALLIRRIDKQEADVELTVADKQLMKGRFLDLATVKTSLKPGGVYSITSDEDAIIVKVDPESKSGKTPLISRLVKL
jgi:hypothetical protein